LPFQEATDIIEQKKLMIHKTIVKIHDVLDKIVGTSGKMDGLSEEQRQKIKALRKKALVLSFKEIKLFSEQNNLEQKSLSTGKGFLSALITMHPNVFVTIGNAKFISRHEYGKTTLQYDAGTQKIITK
ncbi:MAG: hypothetical protein V1913_00610, partial [Fibrobacterota bacterium]